MSTGVINSISFPLVITSDVRIQEIPLPNEGLTTASEKLVTFVQLCCYQQQTPYSVQSVRQMSQVSGFLPILTTTTKVKLISLKLGSKCLRLKDSDRNILKRADCRPLVVCTLEKQKSFLHDEITFTQAFLQGSVLI